MLFAFVTFLFHTVTKRASQRVYFMTQFEVGQVIVEGKAWQIQWKYPTVATQICRPESKEQGDGSHLASSIFPFIHPCPWDSRLHI